MRTARLGLEGCESFVDDLIGCRVLYSVRDALLHRSLEIQPWHFPIRYIKGLKRPHGPSSLFFVSLRLLGRVPRLGAHSARNNFSLPRSVRPSLPSGAPWAGPGLDGRVVQGGRLKFSSLRRRGFEPHSSHDNTTQNARPRARVAFFPGRPPAPAAGV